MSMNHESLHDRNTAHCRLPDFRKALGMFTGRWKLEILWLLYQRSYPVGELRRAIPNITQPVLTTKLRELESDGLIKRTIYVEIPPRVEYEMTAGARQFRPFVCAIMQWASARTHKRTLDKSTRVRLGVLAGS
jgi:DNA-binding HxlR family transcriptional regulator